MDERQHPDFLLRQSLIESLNLDRHALTINEGRWRQLCVTLSCPTTKEAETYSRCLELFQAGQFHLRNLPSDLRASGKRMLDVLGAIHWLLIDRRRARLKVQEIADKARTSPGTVRRATRDLHEALLIHKEDMCASGNGASLYRVLWPNLHNLALEQGWQRPLPGFVEDVVMVDRPDNSSGRPAMELVADEDAFPTVRDDSRPEITPEQKHQVVPAAGSRQPDDSSGQAQLPGAAAYEGLPPPVLHPPPSHCASPPLSLCEPPPLTMRAPPSHISDTPAGAPEREDRTCASFFSLEKKGENPPPSFPPARNQAEEEKENLLGIKEWRVLRDRLDRYGVSGSRKALETAAARGWTSDKVARLMDFFEFHTTQTSEGTLQAFGPGAIVVHLAQYDPGTAYGKAPPSTYFRAKREHELRIARKRDEAKRHEQKAAEPPSEQSAELKALEATYGRRLDSLSVIELDELARDAFAGQAFKLLVVQKYGVNELTRGELLRAMAARAGRLA